MLFVSPRKSGIRVGCWPLNLKCFNKQGKCSSAVMIRWQWLEKGIWWQWLKHLKSDNYMQKRLQKTAKQQYIYTAITCVINHKWNRLIRTVPDITLSQSRWKIQWIMFTPAIPSGGCPAVRKEKEDWWSCRWYWVPWSLRIDKASESEYENSVRLTEHTGEILCWLEQCFPTWGLVPLREAYDIGRGAWGDQRSREKLQSSILSINEEGKERWYLGTGEG